MAWLPKRPVSTGACPDYVDLQDGDDSFDDDDEEYENLQGSDEGAQEEYMNASDLQRQRHSQGSAIDWKPKGPALNKQCGPPKPPSKTPKQSRQFPTPDSENELQYVINPPGKVKQLPPIPGSKTSPGKASTLSACSTLSDQIKNMKLRSTPGQDKSNKAPGQGKSNNAPGQDKPKTSNVIPVIVPPSGTRAKSPCVAMRISPPAVDSPESDNKKKVGGKFPTSPVAPMSVTPKIEQDCPPSYKAPSPPKDTGNRPKHWSTGSASTTDDSGRETDTTDTTSTNNKQFFPHRGGKPDSKPKSGVVGSIDQNLTRFSWFLGDVSREFAEGKVREDGQDGSFIIRKSHHAGADRPFTLAVLYSGKIFNVPIRHLPGDGTYAMGSVKKDELRFASVENVVQHFCLNPIDLVPHDSPGMHASRVVLKYRRAR